MQPSFDQIIDRNEFPTFKWNPANLKARFGSEDVLPFSVADMDFPAPPAVVEALQARAEHGLFGYEYKTEGYFANLLTWYRERYGWTFEQDQLEFCATVMNGLSILINQHSEAGDGVIVQPPVFFEFRHLIRSNDREVIKNPLKLVEGQYEIDFDDLAAKVAEPKNKILILCSPHNPIGRVWSKAELARVAEICLQHKVLVISDEIHGDITYAPHRYVPMASLSAEIAANTCTILSPAKTFNIAGIMSGMVVIPNKSHRERFQGFTHRYQVNMNNVFAAAALEAAYGQGGPWLDELLRYLQGNIDFMRKYLAAHLPQVKIIEPQGTYLLWLDFKALGLEVKELEQFLSREARLAVNPGYWFGREGAGFVRWNIACPRSLLQEALSRLRQAIEHAT